MSGKSWVNWAGNVTYGAKQRDCPRTVAQVQELVAASARAGQRVRVVGTRHCFNGLADVDGLHLALRGLQRRAELTDNGAAVVVDGGITYADLAPVLAARSKAFANLASLPHISVAGAVATATHGSGDANRSLASAVRSLTFVAPSGGLWTVRRGEPGFENHPVHLGLFGPIVEMELDVVDAFDIATTVYEGLPFQRFVDHLDDVTAGLYSFSVAPDWSQGGKCLVFAKRAVQQATAAEVPQDLLGARAALTARHPSPGADPVAVTEQLGRPGPSYARLTHFRAEFEPSVGDEVQSEYLVPRRFAREALAELPAFADDFARLAHSMEIRSVAADDLAASPMCGRDVVAVHLTWRREVDAVMALLPSLEAALEPFEARPHWGKLSTTSAARLFELFPRLPDVDAAARRRDPEGIFRNAWADDLFGVG